MAEHKSDQITNLEAQPPVRMDPTIGLGKVRRLAFTFTTPTGGVAIDDTIQPRKVPSNVRIFGGKIVGEAMSSGGGTAQIRLGDGTDDDKYLGDTSVDAAAQFEFANTIALSFMEKVSGEFVLTATVKGEALVADKKLYGFIEVVGE